VTWPHNLEKKLVGLYVDEMPEDPQPVDDSYRYVYYMGETFGNTTLRMFEFNARLEADIHDTTENNDGGNVTNIYEVGIGIDILGAGQTVGVAVDTTCSSIQWGNTQTGSATCDIIVGDCLSISTCNGLEVTVCVQNGFIVGGPDHGERYTGILNGGNSGNVIVGTNGPDILNGGNGKDTICGLDGDDWIYGQNGQDDIFGGDGTDTADGGNGNDTCTDVEVEFSC